MNTAAAITATFGIDTSQVGEGMRDAERKMKSGTDRIVAHGRAANQQLVHSARAYVDMINNGQSAMRALQVEIGNVTQAMGLGFGALAAIQAVSMLIGKMHEASSSADELYKAVKLSLHSQESPDFSTMDALNERLKKVRAQGEELRKELNAGWFTQIIRGMGSKDILLNAAGQGNRKAEADAAEMVAQKEQNILNIERMRVNISERLAELSKIEQDFEERIGAARKDQNTAQMSVLRQGKELALQEANEKFESKKRELALEERILYIKQQGIDVERRVANARLEFAEDEFKRARTTESKGEGSGKVGAAKLEVSEAQKNRNKRDKQNDERREKAILGIEKEQADIAKVTAEAKRIQHDTALEQMSTEERIADMESERAKLAKSIALDGSMETAEKQKQVAQMDAQIAKAKQLRSEHQQRQNEDRLHNTDRARLTLSDLASHGRGKAAREAREVEKLEKKAHEAALRGKLPDADTYMNRADKIRNSIASIKSTEKTDEFNATTLNVTTANFQNFDLKVK